VASDPVWTQWRAESQPVPRIEPRSFWTCDECEVGVVLNAEVLTWKCRHTICSLLDSRFSGL